MTEQTPKRGDQDEPTARNVKRAQSDVTGVVLLTAVVVVLVSVSGAYVIANAGTDSAPNLTIDAEVTAQNVTITHQNGDRIATADLDVVLRTDTTRRYALDTFTQLQGTDQTRFEPGDRWYRSHGLDGDRMEILVVHTPSDAIIERTVVDVERTLAARVDYSPQNPSTLTDIEFDGSDSDALEGQIQRYEWAFGDGRTASGVTVQHSYDDPGTYTVTLTVESDTGQTATQRTTVDVLPPSPNANFTFDPQDDGQRLAFDATNSEPGDPDGGSIENYSWEFDDGTGETTQNQTVDHTYGSQGVYSVQLTVEDDNGETATTSKVIDVRPVFEVTNLSAPAAVSQGDQIDVSATVENTGTVTDTQSIEYRFNGTTANTTEETLAYQERRTVSLTHTIPSEQETGVSDHGIHSSNDSATAQLNVTDGATEPPFFDVSIDSVEPAVIAGEEITVQYTIRNTGDLGDTQEIVFSVDQSTSERRTVQLDGQTSTAGSFSYTTSQNDIPTVDVRLDSEDTSATESVTVEPRIRIFNARVDGQDNSEVLFDVRNQGSETISIETITIKSTNSSATRVSNGGGDELRFSGGGLVSRTGTDGIEIGDNEYQLNVTESLSGSERTTGRLTEFEDGSSNGQGKSAVDMSGKSVTTTLVLDSGEAYTETLTAADSPYFDIEITGTNSPVERGKSVDVQIETKNIGQETDTQQIQLEFDGTEVGDPLQLQLGPNESSQHTLSYGIPADQETGEYRVRAITDDDDAITTVDVIEKGAPFFEVDILEDKSTLTVVEGANASVVANIRNGGQQPDTQNVSLGIDGIGAVDNLTGLTINDGESTEVTLTWETQTGTAGEYTGTISSEDDDDTVGVSVVEPNTFTKLAVTGIDAGGNGNNPSSIELQYELSAASNVTFSATEAGGDTAQVVRNSTTTGTVTLDFPGGGTNEFPVTLTADVLENECLNTTVESDSDTKSLEDWDTC